MFSNLFINVFTESVNTDSFKSNDTIYKKAQLGEIRCPTKQVVPPISAVETFTEESDVPINIYKNFPADQWLISEAYEGTLVRVYFYDEKWRISTIRKLDAFKSFWGCSKSFGTIFEELIPENFWDSLDNKDDVYLFFMRTTLENRIAHPNPPKMPRDCLIYVGRYTRQNELNDYTQFIHGEDDDKLPNIIRQSCIDQSFLLEKRAGEFPVGLFLTHKPSCRTVKIYSKKYYDNFLLRNNCPNVNFRYMQLLVFDKDKVPEFEKLFEDRLSSFRALKYAFDKFACDILLMYIDRYIRKQNSPEVDGIIFAVLKSIHQWHKTDREHNKANMQIVAKKIMTIFKWSKLSYYLNNIINESGDKTVAVGENDD